MSDSRRTKLARERREREAERARDPAAYRAKIELQRLRDLLAEPFWTAAQAAHIFAGLHPGDAEWGMTTFLPGGRDAHPNDEVRENRIDDSLSYLRGLFSGDARSPNDWMKRAVKFKIEPPWLPAALQDAECVVHLPEDWRKRAPSILARKRPGQDGANAKNANDPVHNLLLHIEGNDFKRWFDANQKDGRVPRGQRESFITTVLQKYAGHEGLPTNTTLRKTMTRWNKAAEAKFYRA